VFLGYDEASLLGHMVGGGRIWPQEEKVNAVKGLKPPNNLKQLQAFLGIVGYYRRFIEGFAKMARPLH
jgi:hypothetical protein